MLARHWGRPFLGVDRKSPKSVQRSDRLPPSLESDFCLVFMAIPVGPRQPRQLPGACLLLLLIKQSREDSHTQKIIF